MKKSELKKMIKEVLTEGRYDKKYWGIVKELKELGADDKKIEYIIGLISDLELDS